MSSIWEPLATAFARLNFKTKIFYTLLGILLVAWIDSQMGFTYHYFTARKIEEIKKYNEIVADPTIDPETKTLVIKERLTVINKARGLVDSIRKSDTDKSIFFHLSYSCIIGLLIILSYWLIKIGNKNLASQKEINQQTVAVILILLIELAIIYLIASFISRYLNGFALYASNIVLQLIALGLTFYFSTMLDKKRKFDEAINRLSLYDNE
jgi:ABC-type Na+ efflux pump permease subunit